MGLLNQSFGRMTSVGRKLNILPEEMKTPQGTLDIFRGKTKPKGGTFFGSAIKRFGKRTKSILGEDQQTKGSTLIG